MKPVNKIILPLILIIISFSVAFSQNDESYKQLIQKYNKSLNLSDKNLNKVQTDNSLFGNKDSNLLLIKNVRLYNEKKYSAIVDIPDTIVAMSLMLEEIAHLNDLNDAFTIKKSEKNDRIIKSLNSKQKEIDFVTQHSQKNLALERCIQCFFSRNIKVIVLKIANNKLDTLPCKSVEYFKNIEIKNNLPHSKFNSYPCQESIKSVSTGNNHIFILRYNNKNYTFTKEIPPGKTTIDCYIITLVLEEN